LEILTLFGFFINRLTQGDAWEKPTSVSANADSLPLLAKFSMTVSFRRHPFCPGRSQLQTSSSDGRAGSEFLNYVSLEKAP
jgi:hypothetical protein